MKILFINSVCGIGSTGRICTDLAKEYEKQGHQVKIAYGRDGSVPEQYREYAIRIGNDLDVKIHGLLTRLFDAHGLGSVVATKKFLKWADEYNPDLVWLHNIHGYYINYELLFAWIKKHPAMEVKWTLHDCWAFTGHCVHFQNAKCEKWKKHCEHCDQRGQYPASKLIDYSSGNFIRKKNAFTGISNLKIITPSHWLAVLVGESFLRDYPIEVQYNKIDSGIFKPTQSNFRERYGLFGKIIVLGVASNWNEQKGLNDFLVLSRQLDDRFAIVLVGLNKQQLKKMPPSILALPRVDNPAVLAEIYTAADFFVNPSKEETFGLTSYEAALCGTPAIVYKGTACEEIADLYQGYVVEQSVDAIYEILMRLCKDKTQR